MMIGRNSEIEIQLSRGVFLVMPVISYDILPAYPSIRQEGPQRCPQRLDLRSAGGRERFRARPLPRRDVATKVCPGLFQPMEICGTWVKNG